jgi:hypothetical protein
MGLLHWQILIVLALKLPVINAHSYNSYPYLYWNDPNSTAPVQDYFAPNLKRKASRPDFLDRPPPGQYRVVELYVHCRYFLFVYLFIQWPFAFASLTRKQLFLFISLVLQGAIYADILVNIT